MTHETLQHEDDYTKLKPAFATVFDSLTTKQHEVFALIAQNRTSKEIAGRLGITESAVNQRIETVRNRTGFPPRAELARAYRVYVGAAASRRAWEQGLIPPTAPIGPNTPLEDIGSFHANDSDDGEQTFSWAGQDEDHVGPRALQGSDAKLNRLAVMVVIAVGLLMIVMVALGVAQALLMFL